MKSVSRTAILAVIILTVLGSMFLVQTNSRSSILIKESIYIAGAALTLLFASLGLLLRGSGRLPFANDRLSRPLLLSFAFLIAWIIFRYFTGIQSVNAPKYIYSTIALCSLTIVIAATFTEKLRDRVLWVMVVSTSLVSIYAVIQSLGVILFPWDAGITGMARSSGTMGNANLLGSFSMAMLPVGSGFLLSRFSLSKLRIPSAAAFAVLCTAALLASKTRGSLIGLFAIVLVLPFIPFVRSNRKVLVSLFLVVIVLLAGAVFILGNRMEELTHTETGTLQVRRLIWSGAFAMVSANPLLGYGPGSFQMMFPQFRDPQYFILGVSHNTLHAHCEYLEILSDTGIVGLILWGAVAYSIFMIVFRKRDALFKCDGNRIEANGWITAGILAGISALAAEALVSVALRWPPSALLLALFTGLLLSSIPSEFKPWGSARKFSVALILLLASILLGGTAVPHYLLSMRSGKELFRGKDMFLVNIHPGIENASIAAQEWYSTGDDNAAQRALYYYDNARMYSDSAIAWCNRCVETNPDELGGWYALGSAYISTARLYQRISSPLSTILRNNGLSGEDPEEAERYMRLGLAAYDSLILRAPNYAEVHNNLALVWINLGYPARALTSLRNAWDLHAHNRRGYSEKVVILNPLVHSPDGIYLKWQISLNKLNRLIIENSRLDTGSFLFRRLLFDYGSTFMRFQTSADSLEDELMKIIDVSCPEIASELEGYLDIQIQRMPEGLELLRRFQDGDTAGVLTELDRIPQNELDILPLQRTLRSRILTSLGDLEGMRTLSEILRFFSIEDIDNYTEWPMDIPEMIRDLNSAILATGLTEYDARRIYLENEITLLNFDRNIFNLIVFIESSPALMELTTDFRSEMEALWERVGGPLYCFMRLRNETEQIPIALGTSMLGDSFSGILELQAQDSSDAEMIEVEIQWLFTFFCSSYNGIPHYSTSQGSQTVSMMADARVRLVALIGENETQYQLVGILDDLTDIAFSRVDDQFLSNIELLKSDLIMGRITQTDLP
jgi:O-antigen ligase